MANKETNDRSHHHQQQLVSKTNCANDPAHLFELPETKLVSQKRLCERSNTSLRRLQQETSSLREEKEYLHKRSRTITEPNGGDSITIFLQETLRIEESVLQQQKQQQ